MILDQPATETLTLTHGAARCDLLPRVGGSIGAWSVSGQEMLRAASEAGVAARNPYATAGFPRVPYSNRIGQGGFEWRGELMTLARNFPPEPHAIHGVGFERPWQVQSRDSDSAVLRLVHRPDAGWPWAFDARQRITLTDDLLILEFDAAPWLTESTEGVNISLPRLTPIPELDSQLHCCPGLAHELRFIYPERVIEHLDVWQCRLAHTNSANVI